MKSDDTIYEGSRYPEPGQPADVATEAMVQVDGEFLDHRFSLKLRNHSPDGFNWGYAGSGPAQLALGLLYDFLEGEDHRDARALHHYQDFKFHVIARLDGNAGWKLTGRQIREKLQELENARPFVADIYADGGAGGEVSQ